MRQKLYKFIPIFFFLFFLANASSFAQTFNGSIVNTAGNSSIPSTGTGGCGVEPQTAVTGGTRFNCAVAGVSPGSTLRSMNINFTHTFDGDLDMYLISPAGAVIELSTDNGGGGDNFTNTEFRDDAAINITAGSAPFTGQFKPEGTLTSNTCGITVTPTVTTMAGMGITSGTWQFLILDDAGGDVGTMLSWSLVFINTLGPCAPSAPLVFSNNTAAPINDLATTTSTITVSGAGAYLYDLNVITAITHTFPADLDITITSPAGTIVTLTSDNAGTNDNVFNGTTWDDNANPGGQVPYASNNGMVTDHSYSVGVTATPLTPEEPLAAFIGENPNGVWTIRIFDDTGIDVGSLNSWSLQVRSLAAAPTTATASGTNNTAQVIPDGSGFVTSTITIAGAGSQLLDVNAITNIIHTFSGDLQVTLQSPAGTIVTLTSGNGSGNDDVFAGTTWNDNADPGNQVPFPSNTFAASRMVTDHAYTNLVVETPLTPEEPLGAFIGENPNGTWTLRVADVATLDNGTLNSWSLNLTTSLCVIPCTLTCPANITTNAQAGICGAVVNYPAPVTTGPCGTVTATPASGSIFPVGTTTVNVSTSSGQTCSFTVTVIDNQPPTITCPANITVNNTTNQCGAIVNYPYPTVSDNCALTGGTAVPLTQSTNNTTILPIQIGCQYFGGQTAENSWWRAYDLAPLNLPTGLTIKSIRMGIERITTATTVPVTVRIWTSAGPFPASARTLRATQTVNLASQTGTFVTVPFTTPPSVAANAIVVVEVNVPDLLASNSAFFLGSNALGQSAPSYISAPACGITTPTDLTDVGFPDDHIVLDLNGEYYITAPTLVQTAGLPRGAFFPVGTTTNTYRATDANGLQSTCSFTVTVVDAQPPTFTLCPPNVTRSTDAGQCYATYTPVQPTFTDNCAITALTWVMTGATTGSSPGTGINFVPSTQFQLTGTTGTGLTTITYTARDAAGNTTNCVSTVRVNDAGIPVISIQPSTKFVCVGSDAVFSVTASAGAGNPLTYQWQQWNGSAWANIAGATASTLTIPAVTFALNTNTYRVVLTGRCSVVISDVVSLFINPLPTVTLTTSIPPSLIPSQSLNITANVSPTGGSFVWRKNGTVIGATGSSLTGLTVDDIGTYRVTYTDPNGCVSTSADVVVSGQPYDKLWVYPNPNFGQFQVRFYNTPGENATVRVFDAKGAKVYDRAVVTGLAYTQIDVDLGNVIAPGIYVVELVNGSGKRVGAKKIDVRRKP